MAQITLLDGGMGQELVHRSGDTPTALWSTQVMLDHPGLVRDIHLDYYKAGANIATTNTYAILRDRLVGTGLEDQFERLNQLALDEAQEAAQGRRIAGSIGPLGASYRSDKHPDFQTSVGIYREKAALIAPAVDIILFETVVTHLQAASALEGAKDVGKPIWLAFSTDDEDGTLLRSGEKLADVLSRLEGAAGVLINCTAPEAIPAGLDALSKTGLPFGAYANGFVQITKAFLEDRPTVDALERRDLSPAAYARYVLDWVSMGATIVGGCCEVGPDHIAEIARSLREAGHEIA